MNKISCFLPYAGKEQVEKTVNSLQATGLIEEIRLITTDATLESLPDCEILFVDMPYSSATLKAIANAAKGEYTLLYTKETTLEMGMFALERMIHILEDSSAGMVYADHYQIADGKQSNAPVIDYQFGSLRDDFNFGSLLLFNTEKLTLRPALEIEPTFRLGTYQRILIQRGGKRYPQERRKDFRLCRPQKP